MRNIMPKNLLSLAEECAFPLYAVGGSVRDFLCGYPLGKNTDWDICAPVSEDELISAAEKRSFCVRAVYRNTGTVKLADAEGVEYEFSRFRSDKYVRGVHTPSEIVFTSDMALDARRRDFTANAVYYEIKAGRFLDPLGGMPDIERRTLRTVAPAGKVFGEDGLRLMRLARQSAQLGFTPDGECMNGAREHSALIRDIAPERIFAELGYILSSDKKHGCKDAPYRGLCILRDTGVLREIMPELALGDGMAQRSDFHAHDVLEHSLRCASYAPERVRIPALLHDVGKPFCMMGDGNFYAHPEEGARIAREILTRLKAPKKLTDETERLILLHMRDFNLKTGENKVRRTIVENYPLLPDLFALMQADFSACKDDFSPAPVVEKWKNILEKMRREGAPRTLSELAVNGDDIHACGIRAQDTGRVLNELLLYCAYDGSHNRREHLLRRVNTLYKENL